MTRDGDFDLVAVDHYMPGMDGLATLERLRALPDCPPIVYVTGSEESRIAVAALKSGADDYVVKSVGAEFFDLLASSFAQVLDREQLRRARAQAEAELRASNARLEALLREVNHRVANNLQMVISFVALQAKSVTDPLANETLQQTQQRIATIAQVNRRLYTSGDVEFVAMDDYLRALAADLSETWSTTRAVREVLVSAPPIKICTDKAVALGMIANEWVSNACKYAYGEAAHGTVHIALSENDDQTVELSVEDQGVGLPEDGVVLGTGLGTKLIAVMAGTMGGDLRYRPADSGKGTRASVTLRLDTEDRP